MSAPNTCVDFLDLLRKSGVVPDTDLCAYLDTPSRQLPEEPKALSRQLVRDGILTHFQAEQLLAGRYKGFRLGQYLLLERLGRGGMGQVFLAQHEVLKRRVALKVLPPTLARNEGVRERFMREGRAAAALDHPNIVRLYDVGQEGMVHFLVLQYIDGVSLQGLVDRLGPLSVGRAVQYITQAADGLQAVHLAGLIHRDIKPANLMLTREGQVKLLDLGLARFFHDTADELTARLNDKSILGTADYLAPEQGRDSRSADIRSDIYSLAATLYFLLVGRPPFEGNSITQKLLAHQIQQPSPLRTLSPDVPEGLEAVVCRAMSKDPSERYATPADFAAAIAPWLPGSLPPPAADEFPSLCPALRPKSGTQHDTATILAKSTAVMPMIPAPSAITPIPENLSADLLEPPPFHQPPHGRLHSPVFFGIFVAALTAVTAWLVLESVWQPVTVAPSADTTKSVSNEALAGETPSRPVDNDGCNPPPVPAIPALPVQPPAPPPPSEPIAANKAVLDFVPVFTLMGHTDQVVSLAFSPDSTQLTTTSLDLTIRVWDVVDGKELRVLSNDTQKAIRSIAYFPEGRRLLTAGGDTRVRLRDSLTGETIWQYNGHRKLVHSVVVSADGRLALSVSVPEAALLWDTATRKTLHRLRGHEGHVLSANFTPDGRYIFTGGADGTVRLWNTNTGAEVWKQETIGRPKGICTSPDGKTLAVGTDQGAVVFLDLLTGVELSRLSSGHRNMTHPRFLGEGRYLVVSNLQGVHVWDTTERKLVASLPLASTGRGIHWAISPNGKYLALSSAENSVRVFSIWR